mmetsp:Transcript_113258/g.293155  ORF Transcript_113258/g.293155 Transcript_113258/m.293155 type:complete len:226 (-) Transcript_113258:95-772(-)
MGANASTSIHICQEPQSCMDSVHLEEEITPSQIKRHSFAASDDSDQEPSMTRQLHPIQMLSDPDAMPHLLPSCLQDAEKFATQAKRQYLVDNSRLQAATRGLGLRLQKIMDDTRPKRVVPWGSVVVGVDGGDGWLICEDGYLPTFAQGVAVLTPMPAKWFKVLLPGVSNVRSAQNISAPVLRTKSQGECLLGYEEGDWIALAEETGYMKMRSPRTGMRMLEPCIV